MTMDLKNRMPLAEKTILSVGKMRPVAATHREMNRLFQRFFNDLDGGTFPDRAGGFIPRIDVAESDKDVLITAELPGMDEKDIDITTTKDILTIRGEKKVERTSETVLAERAFGPFSRTLSLPREVDHEKAQANIRQGVLTVKLPKAEQNVTESRKIQVRTG
jgi:HSP20 family protein